MAVKVVSLDTVPSKGVKKRRTRRKRRQHERFANFFDCKKKSLEN